MGSYDKSLYKVLGNILRQYRNEHKYSLEYVANMIGMTKKTIQRYELGEQRISVENLEKICNLYGIDVTDINNEVNSVITKQQSIDADSQNISTHFTSAEKAMKFIVEQPMIAAYGGYNPDDMSDEELIEFANDVLDLLKIAARQRKK